MLWFGPNVLIKPMIRFGPRTMCSLASRAMPVGDSGVVGSMMVEALWESMGPLEHTWLERFVPDCRQKYPLETEWVTPRNAAIAVGHYGLTPLFNYRLLNYVGRFTRAKALPLNPLPFRAWSFKNPSRGARIPRQGLGALPD